jgi:hypothetical protein
VQFVLTSEPGPAYKPTVAWRRDLSLHRCERGINSSPPYSCYEYP